MVIKKHEQLAGDNVKICWHNVHKGYSYHIHSAVKHAKQARFSPYQQREPAACSHSHQPRVAFSKPQMHLKTTPATAYLSQTTQENVQE